MTSPPASDRIEIAPLSPIGTIAKLATVDPAPATFSVDDDPSAAWRYGSACTYPPPSVFVTVRLIATAVAVAGTPAAPVTVRSSTPPCANGPMFGPTAPAGRVSTMRTGAVWR